MTNDTQVFPLSKVSFVPFVYMLSSSIFTISYMTSTFPNFTLGSSKDLLLDERQLIIPGTTRSHFQVTHQKSAVKLSNGQFFNMYRPISLDSIYTDSHVFYVERSLGEQRPTTNDTPEILNSIQLSGALACLTITISSVASSQPQIVTIESHSNEPTMPYSYGRKQIDSLLAPKC